jgi:DNA-directed RNA polymerase subunit M/transcription elongation factor TFIIS
MAARTKKTLLGAITAATVILVSGLAWLGISGCSSKADAPPQSVTVLCANEKCGFSGQVELKSLVFAASGAKRPARMPSVGPGYKCPKCGQNTLYTDPMKCNNCGTLFLPRQDASGAFVQSCPKCGKSQ